MRAFLSGLAELIGFGCLVYAGYLVALEVALVVLGIGLIVGAQAGRR